MKKLLYLGCLLIILSACAKKIDKPLWLHIDKWQLNNNPFASGQGEMSENISDVWLNMDGKALGVFSLPITIPIIGSEGEHQFILTPGIKNNGISSTKTRYTFMENYSVNLNLSNSDTAQISPETQYFENLNFWVEDFENINNLKIEENPVSQVDLETTNDANIVKYGNYCGHIQLTDVDTFFYASAVDPMFLPQNAGKNVFMEVDFLNAHDLSARLIYSVDGFTNDDALVTMAAQENPVWKKIYINLQEVILARNDADFYAIALRAIKSKVGVQDIYIDNIKVIYQE